MYRNVVRLESIEIRNFKNVKYGALNFENTRKPYSASILGLYGQNGSGKTALIDALSLLKYLLTGQQVPSKFADCIHVDAQEASFCFRFKVVCQTDSTTEYIAAYECSIRKDSDESVANMDQASKYKVTVFHEVLSASFKNAEQKSRFSPLIDTRTEKVFLPISKFRLLAGENRSVETDLLVAKKLAAATARSFIFSRELVTMIRSQCKEKQYLNLYNALVNYGNLELFIIDTANSGLISINALPLSFSYKEKGHISAGSIMIQLNGVSIIPEQAVDVVRKVILSMNLVLKELVPGLTIDVKELGTQLQENGIKAYNIQLISLKNNKSMW